MMDGLQPCCTSWEPWNLISHYSIYIYIIYVYSFILVSYINIKPQNDRNGSCHYFGWILLFYHLLGITFANHRHCIFSTNAGIGRADDCDSSGFERAHWQKHGAHKPAVATKCLWMERFAKRSGASVLSTYIYIYTYTEYIYMPIYSQ